MVLDHRQRSLLQVVLNSDSIFLVSGTVSWLAIETCDEFYDTLIVLLSVGNLFIIGPPPLCGDIVGEPNV
jgi:hypothetical protein